MGDSGIVSIVTVAVAVVLVPVGPVAVSTYLVVVEGVAVAEPLTGRLPLDTAGAMPTDVAPVVVQANETDCPGVTWLGVTCKDAVGKLAVGAGEGIGLPPPQPLKAVAMRHKTAEHQE
jgi:hypothetical protein